MKRLEWRFEAEFLEEGGGLFDLSRMESKGGADTEIDSGREEVFIFCDPMLLFGAT